MKQSHKTIEKAVKKFFNKNFIGFKQSFEDEGALLDDVKLIRKISKVNDLKLSVKIGGCEAKSDIRECLYMGVDGIVSPMVETEFSLQKFIESVSGVSNTDFYINIESKTGYENIDKILLSPYSKMLSGIVVGRSDLSKSYGYDKSFVDSEFIYNITYDILKKAKLKGFKTLVGGNLTDNSIDFFSKLKDKNVIDCVETRNVIIKVNDISELKSDVTSALEFETIWLNYKYEKYKELSDEYFTRSKVIKKRL